MEIVFGRPGVGRAAYVADLTASSQRAQALALLRCAGDGGLMIGASLLGCVADLTTLGEGRQGLGDASQ